MRLISVLSALALAIVVSACAGKKVVYEGGAATKSTTTGPGIASTVVWLKNKKQTLDVNLRLTNEYAHPVLFRLSQAKMTFGGVSVAPRDSGGIFELGAGMTAERVMIFPFGATKAMAGVAELTLIPQHDGKDLPPLMIALTVQEK